MKLWLRHKRERKLKETIAYVTKLQQAIEHQGPMPFRGMMKTEFDINIAKIARLKRKLRKA